MTGNRIACAVAAIIAFVALVSTNSAAALGLLLLVVCVPVASMVVGRIQLARTRLAFSLKGSCVAGDDLGLKIAISRPRMLKSRVELLFEIENPLLGALMEQPVSLSPTTGKVERYTLPLYTGCPGALRIQLVSARAHDVLGFFELSIPGATFKKTCTVYPRTSDIELHVGLTGARDDSNAAFDLDCPGHDRSEVFELRDFQQGDSAKDVHWKLSARTRDLVVRVPSRPAGHTVALLCGIHSVKADRPEAQTSVAAQMGLLASVSLGLLRAGTGHTLIYATGGGPRALLIEGAEDFQNAFDELLCSPLQHKVLQDAESFTAFKSEYGIEKTIVVTDLVNDEMLEKLGDPGQISVLHVDNSLQTGADSLSAFRLMHVSVDDLPERIKVLEL